MILQKPSSIGNSPICDHIAVAEDAGVDKLRRNLTVTWLTVDWRHNLTEIGRLCMGGRAGPIWIWIGLTGFGRWKTFSDGPTRISPRTCQGELCLGQGGRTTPNTCFWLDRRGPMIGPLSVSDDRIWKHVGVLPNKVWKACTYSMSITHACTCHA